MGLLCVALLCSQVISSQNDNTHVTFAVFVFGGMCLWFWAKQATNSLQCFTLHCCVRLKAGCVSGSCSMSSKWPPWVPSQQLLQFPTRQTHRTHFYMIFQLTFKYIWNPVAIFQYILYMSDFQRERNHHQEVVWLTSVCIFTVHWSHEWFFNQLLRHFKCLAWICLFRLSFVVALYWQ